jgi:putative phage-type endonuclease
MERQLWLEGRRKGIGGSDAAKVLGISSYGGPLTVYLDKKGKLPEMEMSEAAEMGIELEDTVANLFTRRTGLKVARVGKTASHPDYPWMIANVDRRIVGENKGLECKTAHFMKGQQWEGDDLPDDYYAQCQHYMAVMGWESCWIAALIGGQRFSYKEVARDGAFIDMLVEQERAFWCEYVLKDIEPPANWSDKDLILDAFPVSECDEMIPALSEHLTLLSEIFSLEPELKRIEQEIESRKNRLRMAIGACAGIQGVATYRNNKDKAITDWQGIARKLGASNELIAEFTTTKPGDRPLRLNRKAFAQKEAA